MPPRSSSSSGKLSDDDFVQLANFRYALRCFLEFSEAAAVQEGITPQQHQALLVIRAQSKAKATTVGHLAERLRIRHNTAVELAQRLEAAGMITRKPSPADRRVMLLALTRAGSGRLERLTRVHRAELKQLSPEIVEMLQSLETVA